MAVNTRKSIPQIIAEDYDYFVGLSSTIEQLAGKYAARKRTANLMDFDLCLGQFQHIGSPTQKQKKN